MSSSWKIYKQLCETLQILLCSPSVLFNLSLSFIDIPIENVILIIFFFVLYSSLTDLRNSRHILLNTFRTISSSCGTETNMYICSHCQIFTTIINGLPSIASVMVLLSLFYDVLFFYPQAPSLKCHPHITLAHSHSHTHIYT